MPPWFDPLLRLGAPSLGMAVLGYFLFRYVWNFMVSQVTYYQGLIEKNTREFTATVSQKDATIATMANEIASLRQQLQEHMSRFKG